MLVVATGARTRFGGIAAALRSDEPPSALERGLHALGILIVRLTVFLLFVLLVHLASGRPALEAFLFAVALAVGLDSRTAPAITTVTLSRGALRMAAQKVIVKRLAGVHDLGEIDVLCTDKTGTLTEASIRLVGHPGPEGADAERVLELAAVNSRFASSVQNPLDQAILDHAADLPLAGWQRVAVVPFDFQRRRVSVLAEKDGRWLLLVKGAPEEILARSAAVEAADGMVSALDDAGRARLGAVHEEKAAQGLRCLAIAWRQLPAGRGRPLAEDERELVFAGHCVFADPPKVSAADAVARLGAAEIEVKVVSGDAAPVVQHLVGALGLPVRGLLTGPEIERLSDAALSARVEDTDVFARVAPDQKTRIVRPCRRAATPSGSSAMASTTHPRSRPRTPDCRSRARRTSPAPRPT